MVACICAQAMTTPSYKEQKKLAPLKGIRIAEPEKILLVESGILGFRNTAQGIWISPTI